MSRPLLLEDLENVYSEMNTKWLNSPERWSIDPLLCIEDSKVCLAIYTLDMCKLEHYTWNRLMEWMKPLLEYGILYNNNPNSSQGKLHFTFHQLSKFGIEKKYKDIPEQIYIVLQNYLKQLSGFEIIFRGLLVTPTGIALRGYPTDDNQLQKLMNARNQLKTILESVEIYYDPPYINDICHSTLFRWTKKPTEEIIRYIQHGIQMWNEAYIGSLHPKEWCIGYGTLIMQKPTRIDLAQFYCPTFIAHRGLTSGPDKAKENSLETLKERYSKGLMSECDIWLVGAKLFLGHDEPSMEINFEDINSSYLLLHAKNKEAYEYLLYKANYEGFNLNVFWHTEEDYVLTNRGDSIVYPGKELIKNSIFMMPENSMGVLNNGISSFICSDYII
jgi:hypothetical protein